MAQVLQLLAEVKAQAAKTTLQELDRQVDALRQKKIEITYNDDYTKKLRDVRQLTDEYGNLYTQVTKLNKKTGEYTTTTKITENFDKASKSTKELGSAAEVSAKKIDLLGDAFNRLGQIAIANVTRSIRDALDEMKKVDSALIVVRKVTDASDAELGALKDRAYETAKQYGVVASDYLNAAAEFSRAGYKDKAGDLAELAVKLQLVGDVSQDVANKFLIATDKSFKFDGAADKLSETIDKANEIDNNYATTIEKVASGMGIIAPVAAQLNVSLDETMAAVGTITAVTQRSGTEAARALRAIMLNVIGDTKTEIEDGATWTAGEIIGLRDLLNKYAPEIVKKAQDMGTVINPMEAIGALAKAYKDGMLTAQELTEKVSDIGGKLRTPQLLALIQNWDDMYVKMLTDIKDASGSADKEVQNALTGWEAKLNILKNTWTDFVQQTIESDFIKKGLDTVTGMLDAVGNLGNALAIVAPLVVSIKAARIDDWFMSLGEALNGAGIASVGASMGFMALSAAIAGLVVGYNKHKKSVNDELTASSKKVDSYLEETQTLFGLKQAYDDAVSGSGSVEAASSALAGALSSEDGVVKTLIEDYEQLNKEYEKKQANDFAKAKAEAMRGMTIAASEFTNPWNLGNRAAITATTLTMRPTSSYTTNDGVNWFPKYGQKYQDILSPYFSDGFSDNRMWNWDWEDADNMLQFYHDIIDAMGEIEKYAAEMNDPSELSNPLGNYQKLSFIAQNLEGLVKPIEEQKSALIEAEAAQKAYNYVVENGIPTQIKAAAWLSENKTGIKEIDDALEKALKSYMDAAPEAEDDTDGLKNGTQDLIKTLGDLSDELANATAGIERYKKALADGEKGDAFKSYANMYKRVQELYEKGLYGTNEFKAAVRELVGDSNMLSEFNWSYVDAAERILNSPLYQAMFANNGEDYGWGLADYIRQNADQFGNLVSVVEQADGTYSILINDQEALASIMQMSNGLLESNVDGWDAYSEKLTLTSEDLNKFFTKYKDSIIGINTEGKKIVNTSELVKGLVLDGFDTGYIYEVVHALQDLQDVGEIELDVSSTPTDEMLSTLISNIKEAQTQLDDNHKIELECTSNFDDVANAIGEGIETLNKNSTVYVKVVQVGSVLSSVSQIPSFSGTGGGGAGSHGGVIMAKASGGKTGKSGLALVNEEAPELISDKGRAFIAGGGRPAIVDLSADAIVFSGKDTKNILSRSGANALSSPNGISAYGGSTITNTDSSFTGSGVLGGSGAGSSNDSEKDIKQLSETVSKIQENTQKSADTDSRVMVGILTGSAAGAKASAKNDMFSTKDARLSSGIPTENPFKTEEEKEKQKPNGGGKKKEEETKPEELLSMLTDYVSELLDKAKKALDEQIETIDAEIEKLKNEHDAQEEANELEELRLRILEAEKDLVDANVERTVRYFNKATGQWEWMADQQAVATAQKNLEDAQQAYYDKLAEMEYQAKLDELEAQKEALNKNYDNLSNTWNELKNDISKALSDKNVLALADVLTKLGLTAASGSVAGVNSLIANINDFTGSFDNGGFAFGKGYLRKAITKGETILDDSITDRILSPRSNSQFTSFTNSLTKLFGMSSGDIGAKAQSLINSISRSSSVTGDTYYINGVRIGSDMVDRPLSEILSVLPIYAG